MLINRTPLRISFVGGGSDLPSFYQEHSGAVVSMAIDKYFYLSMHQSFEKTGYLLKYSKVENVEKVDDIEHRIIHQVFKDKSIDGVDFSSAADIPGGTGLASSSAFTVGLLSLCDAYNGNYTSQMNLASDACEVEIEKLNEPIGKQDQYGCAIGGIKFIEFLPDESVKLTPIFLAPKQAQKLNSNLLLVYLGGPVRPVSFCKSNHQT